jgi:endoribonuclease Dicer
MADVVESLLGAVFVKSGSEGALWFANVLQLFPDPVSVSVQTQTESQKVSSHPLENVLKYEFRDRRLLIEALTHASFQNASTCSYQRLEYLGDAALDVIVTQHLYTKFPVANSMHISDMRQAVVTNSSLARMAVSLGIQQYIQHGSDTLGSDISAFVEWYDEGENKNMDPNELTFDAPKVLGDVFESICGAVVVDCDYDIVAATRVFDPILSEFIERHCTLDKARRNPIRRLYETAQSIGYDSNQIELRILPVPDIGYTCQIFLAGKFLTDSSGNTETTAKRLACIRGLEQIQVQN